MTVQVATAHRVLLLNGNYRPLKVVTVRKAFELMCRGVVDSVDGIAARLHSTGVIFEIPSVLVLRRYVRVPQRGAIWGRRAVVNRDNCTCIYCGVTIGNVHRGRTLTRANFTVDHLIPISRGGGNTWGNTACACHWCNHRKGARLPHEAGMALLWEPKRPRVNYVVASGDIPSEWKVYLRTA